MTMPASAYAPLQCLSCCRFFTIARGKKASCSLHATCKRLAQTGCQGNPRHSATSALIAGVRQHPKTQGAYARPRPLANLCSMQAAGTLQASSARHCLWRNLHAQRLHGRPVQAPAAQTQWLAARCTYIWYLLHEAFDSASCTTHAGSPRTAACTELGTYIIKSQVLVTTSQSKLPKQPVWLNCIATMHVSTQT